MKIKNIEWPNVAIVVIGLTLITVGLVEIGLKIAIMVKLLHLL